MDATDTATPLAPASPLILGAMGWGAPRPGDDDAAPAARAAAALRAGLAAGIAVVDTADIYGAGVSEETVGAVLDGLDPAERARVRVQTKCGIVLDETDPQGRRVPRYDSSPRHVRASLEASLARMGADHVDTLIVHRPDVLTPVEDTVRAFLDAREAGLVDRLGVSNLGAGRVRAFQRSLRSLAADGTSLACAQLELGLHHRTLVEAVVLANHPDAPADADVADLGALCADEGIELQAWGPLGQGRYTRGGAAVEERAPSASGDPAVADPADAVAEVAAELGVSGEAVVLGWLLRLPWGVRPVIGTQDPARIAACAQAPEAAAAMDAARWHRLWTAARGALLP